jgi:outer membrane lipoprotein carrier protein
MMALMLALLVAPPAPSAAEVLKSLEASGRQLRTLQADFAETKVNVILSETQQTRGRVALEVPGRLRWDYLAPQPGVMVLKDGRFARYVPQSKQVFRGAARGEADLLVGFGPGTAELGRKYEVKLAPDETVGGIATHVLDLTPRQPGLFSAIRLWVDTKRGVPVQTRLTEPTGDHTTIRFDKVVVNGKLPADAFELKLPKDVVEVQ